MMITTTKDLTASTQSHQIAINAVWITMLHYFKPSDRSGGSQWAIFENLKMDSETLSCNIQTTLSKDCDIWANLEKAS